MLELVTGGSGSGKSAYAESRICEWNRQDPKPLFYIATMYPYGEETEKKIERQYLPKVLEKNGVQMVFFMLTDILDESTELLCCGARAKEYIIDAFDLKENTEKMILKGVVSRKKQLIPTLVSELQQ